MKQQMERGGSVVGFIVICLVAAALLVGSVYVVRHTGWFGAGQQSSSDEGSSTHKTDDRHQTSTKDNEDNTLSNTSSDSEQSAKKSDKSSKNTASNNSTGSSASGDQSSEHATDTPSEKTSDTSAESSTEESTNADNSELPHTGPADVLASTLGIFSLSAAFLMYTRSRRLA